MRSKILITSEKDQVREKIIERVSESQSLTQKMQMDNMDKMDKMDKNGPQKGPSGVKRTKLRAKIIEITNNP